MSTIMKSKKEAYKLIISIDDYMTLLDEIENSIPENKTVSYVTIMSILENNRKVINPIKDKLYF